MVGLLPMHATKQQQFEGTENHVMILQIVSWLNESAASPQLKRASVAIKEKTKWDGRCISALVRASVAIEEETNLNGPRNGYGSKIPGTQKTLLVKGNIDPATCGPHLG